MKLWTEYFQGSLTSEVVEIQIAALEHVYDDPEIELAIIVNVRKTIQRLKNSNSAGLDEIRADLFLV